MRRKSETSGYAGHNPISVFVSFIYLINSEQFHDFRSPICIKTFPTVPTVNNIVFDGIKRLTFS